jgi:hypothetical protein
MATATTVTRASLPPFARESAIQKVRLAEDGWNARDPGLGLVRDQPSGFDDASAMDRETILAHFKGWLMHVRGVAGRTCEVRGPILPVTSVRCAAQPASPPRERAFLLDQTGSWKKAVSLQRGPIVR